MQRGLIIAGITTMLLLNVTCALVSAWALYSRFSETNQRRLENAAVWHAVICKTELAVLGNKKATPAQKRFAVTFYDGLLTEQVHTTGCGLQVR